MKHVICFDTICTGYSPVMTGDLKAVPLLFDTEAEAQKEIDDDPEFYDDCFVCLESDIGHKTIYRGENHA